MKHHLPTAMLAALALAATAGAEYTLKSSTIDGGGGTLTGSTYVLRGTVGQVDAEGTLAGTTYALTGGFWPGAAVPPPACVGDLDGDGDTDVFDFGVFAPNFGATVTPFTGGDLDGDGDVDVFDFGIFGPDFGCTP